MARVTPRERAQAALATPEGREKCIATLRQRLRKLEQREAPMIERASTRELLAYVEHVHAWLSLMPRAPIVPN